MEYVLLAEHSAEVCPTSNAKIREALAKAGPEVPALAKKLGVKILSGPWVSREHLLILAVEAERGEALDRFIHESTLAQWNKVRVVPVKSLEAGMKETNETPPLF